MKIKLRMRTYRDQCTALRADEDVLDITDFRLV